MTQEKNIKTVFDKLDNLISRIYSEGGDQERGIHEQVHHLENKIEELNEKIDSILTILKRIENDN
jgi:hypothetical protein